MQMKKWFFGITKVLIFDLDESLALYVPESNSPQAP